MLAVSVARFVIWPQGPFGESSATVMPLLTVTRYSCSGHSDQVGVTRLANYEAVPCRMLQTNCVALRTYLRERLLLDTLLALGSIIAAAPGSAGMVLRALFRAVVSFPPASAKSGLPPPDPPTSLASACISLPAWTLAVRSLVTPAIRATFSSWMVPRTTTPDPSFCLRESTNCLRVSLSIPETSAAISFDPFDGLDLRCQLVHLAEGSFAFLAFQLLL